MKKVNGRAPAAVSVGMTSSSVVERPLLSVYVLALLSTGCKPDPFPARLRITHGGLLDEQLI
jgi:hypothetical protein